MNDCGQWNFQIVSVKYYCLQYVEEVQDYNMLFFKKRYWMLIDGKIFKILMGGFVDFMFD